MSLIIRASGERTMEVAQRLAKKQIGEKAEIVVIQEAPFETALRASYEEGIRIGATWTVTLDADVLLIDKALERLIKSATDMPGHFFELEGHIYDKVTGRFRQAGHRVYRTELLDKALSFIPPAGQVIQPEFHTVSSMRNAGHPFRHVHEVVGLHDFEQYFCDLYRKSRAHARKMGAYLPSLIQRCSILSEADPDFLVVRKGIWDELTTRDKVAVIDHRFFEEEALAAIHTLGLTEKAPVSSEETSIKEILASADVLLATETPPPAQLRDYATHGANRLSPWAKLISNVRQRGLIRGTASTVGAGLKTAGQWLDS